MSRQSLAVGDGCHAVREEEENSSFLSLLSDISSHIPSLTHTTTRLTIHVTEVSIVSASPSPGLGTGSAIVLTRQAFRVDHIKGGDEHAMHMQQQHTSTQTAGQTQTNTRVQFCGM